jgi:excisionase family DNA binding protein
MEKVTMSVKELAAAMGVSLPKAYDMTEMAGFPVIRVGRSKKIPVDQFRAWLDAQCPVTAPALAGTGAGLRRV